MIARMMINAPINPTITPTIIRLNGPAPAR